MKTMLLAVASTAMIASVALAGATVEGRGFEWVEVDNGGVSDASGANLAGPIGAIALAGFACVRRRR